MPFVDLFVYGTLKQGCSNFAPYCGHAREVVPASVPGWLYDLPYGFPGVVIPRERILAEGSEDPEADAALQRSAEPPSRLLPVPGWDRVQGEVMRLPDPARSLPPVDDLEDFRPDGRGMYRRALVPAETPDGLRVVWMYWLPEVPRGRYLPGGRWPAQP